MPHGSVSCTLTTRDTWEMSTERSAMLRHNTSRVLPAMWVRMKAHIRGKMYRRSIVKAVASSATCLTRASMPPVSSYACGWKATWTPGDRQPGSTVAECSIGSSGFSARWMYSQSFANSIGSSPLAHCVLSSSSSMSLLLRRFLPPFLLVLLTSFHTFSISSAAASSCGVSLSSSVSTVVMWTPPKGSRVISADQSDDVMEDTEDSCFLWNARIFT
mmetsp:Transcript_11506/g.33409  ORF Transcript_11506/g.33409 Transcript_11506/m.33409 type:complete len:216 (+) Transcript_11506:2525-3172(+)